VITAYHLTAAGPFKPYVRMTQRGKWVKRDAQEYLDSKRALALQFTLPLFTIVFAVFILAERVDIEAAAGTDTPVLSSGVRLGNEGVVFLEGTTGNLLRSQ